MPVNDTSWVVRCLRMTRLGGDIGWKLVLRQLTNNCEAVGAKTVSQCGFTCLLATACLSRSALPPGRLECVQSLIDLEHCHQVGEAHQLARRHIASPVVTKVDP